MTYFLPKKFFQNFTPIILLIFLISISSELFGQQKQETKIDDAIQVLKDFGSMKENIPHELLKMSEGIIIVPKMINAGFVLAGKRGRGIAMVKNDDGSWSDPVFVSITGGSVGFQVGVQSVDLVLIFKNRETLKNINSGTFTLGGDISAAVGPVGRNSSATTDYKLEAEVYSYSRSKGLFAGISLAGSAINVDDQWNTAYYRSDLSATEIFDGTDADDARISALKQELQSMYI